MGLPTLATPVIWNNLKIEYIGPLLLDYDLDGKDRNAKIKITNVSNKEIQNIHFQIAIQGVGEYPKVVGDGGFAVFPNGGNIDLAPGESYIAQHWLQGIYEARFGNTPPVKGQTKTYSIDFILATDNAAFQRTNPVADPVLAGKLTQAIAFSRFDYGMSEFLTTTSAALVGGQTLSGSIALPNGPVAGLTVEIGTPYSRWYSVETKVNGAVASFATTVPARDDWVVRVTADNQTSTTLSAAELADAGQITLSTASALSYGYQVSKTAEAPVGYWRGAVSESERTFVLIPGQENWSDPGDNAADAALRATSLIRKYNFSGDLLWEYAPGWETWGGDMTADGSRVVFLLNPDIIQYSAGEWTLGVLDGSNGSLLWSVTGDVPYLGGLEASISDDGRYVAAGSAQGALGLHDAVTGALLWQKTSGTFGQVRKIAFVNEFLYIGSGDGYLVKLVAATGEQVWKAYVGGWPFVNGLDINEPAGLIAVGTKSKDTTVINAQTGEILWSRQTGALDAVMSADGKYVANFYGDIFDARSGALVGQTGVGATAIFSPDSQYLIQADRGLVVIADLSGKILSRSVDNSDTGIGGGEQAQWSYLSADGSTLLVASRDMDTPGERALTIWSRGDPVPLANNPPGLPGQNLGNNPDDNPQPANVAPTPGNDQFDARPGANIIDGGEGIDQVVYELNRADFDLIANLDSFVVQSKNGTYSNTLKNIERIKFNDTSIALDVDKEQIGGQAVLALGALLGPDSINNPAVVGLVVGLLDDGMSFDELAVAAIEALSLQSNDALVTTLWTNIVGAAPSESDKASVIALLDSGTTPAELIRLAAYNEANETNVDLVGLAQRGLEFSQIDG